MAGAAAKPKVGPAKPQAAQTSQAGGATAATAIPETSNALHLQNLIGNQALGRLLGGVRAQAKLSVNAPGDRFEAEADRVADSVMRRPASQAPCKCGRCDNCERKSGGVSSTPVRVQRWSASPARGVAPPSVDRVLARSGNPLPRAVRGDMEARFGHDFSAVRVHADPDAARSARDLQANAYTVGDHIVFGEGRFAPGTPRGGHLLAHELTHVLQQRAGVSRQVQRDDIDDPATSHLARELIPTATVSFSLNVVMFTVDPQATFQAGSKTLQMVRITLHTLLQEQYTEKLALELTTILEANKDKYHRHGHFQDKREAFEGEKIGGFKFSVDPFRDIIMFLEARNLEIRLDDEQFDQWALAIATDSLWNDVLREAKKAGKAFPKWYGQEFFAAQMRSRGDFLGQYGQSLQEFLETRNPTARDVGLATAADVFEDVYFEAQILEAIRTDIALYRNPFTMVAYQSMWYLTDKTRNAGKPAPGLRNIENPLALLEFLNGDNVGLLSGLREKHEARRDLLIKFSAEQGFPEQNFKELPPYNAFIVAPDLNEDHTTVTTAKNMFRMVNESDKLHGGPLIHGVTIAMKRTILFSWEVVPLPESLKFMHERGTKPDALVKEADLFVKNSPQNIPAAIKAYGADEDRDQTIRMADLGIGSYLLVGHAAPHYAEDMHWIQQPGSAGFPFFVFDARTLARNTAYGEWDQLQGLKKQAEQTDNKEDKKALEDEVARLEAREGSGLGEITGKDLKETQKLIDAAKGLRKYIEEDRAQGKSRQGDSSTDPFIVRLKNDFPALHDVYLLIREMYDPRRYDDFTAIDEYLKILEGQRKQLAELGERVGDAEGRFKADMPVYRVVAAIVKKDDGNAVPMLLMAGHHPDSVAGKYKIKLVDVTFKGKPKDMIYVGEARGDEEAAMRSAFDTFADDSKYGEGQVVWRVPKTGWKGAVTAEDNVWDYLQYAIAALGIIMLVMGTIASAGLLSPVAAAVVTAIGVSLAVVGAAMSIRNMQKREEQGVLEMDTETALDIINIIGAVVMVVGTVTKISAALRTATLARTLMLQRLDRLIAVYDITEIGANVYLTASQVKEDVDAINKLDIPQHEKDAMISSVTFDAIQQGAMISFSIHGTLKGIPETFRTRVEHSPYKSWMEKGWITIDKKNKVHITDTAPPFLKSLRDKAGTVKSAAEQGEVARRATIIEPLHQTKTHDEQHALTLTERGRIIRCSDFCQDLRARYQKMLERDPELHQKLVVIEDKAAKAAQAEDKAAAKTALEEAAVLEDSLRAKEAQWLKMTGESDLATPKIELKPIGTVSGGPGGVKIEPVGGGGNPARKLDVVDFMTPSEHASPGGMQMALDRLGTVLGRPLTEVPAIRQHWDAAVNKVLKGKSSADLPGGVTGSVYDKVMKEFWGLVSQDRKAVKLLDAAGIEVDARGAAAKLGPAGKDKRKNASAKQERRVSVGWRKDAAGGDNLLDPSRMELVFGKPVIEAPQPRRRGAPEPTGPAAKPPLVLSPDEIQLQAHGRGLGMLQSEIDLMIEQFRKHGMPVNEMMRQLTEMASTRQSNPRARARMAPDYVLDSASRAKLPHEEQKVAGTGGIETITVRDDPEGGIAVTILGKILPRRLARRAADVTATRRRAPDFNASGKLFSNRESKLNRFWQRLHLWGPGFGDEAAAGMMWGPRDVNLDWQNGSIEDYIRNLATVAERRGMDTHVKATAVSWGDPTPSGFKAPKGERFLKTAEYTVTLKRPGEPDTTIRVTLEVNEPPKGGVKSFTVDPPSAVNLGNLF